MMFLPRWILLLAATAIAAVSAARPLDTDDTGTVPRGQWELEGGVDFVRAGTARSLAFNPAVAYGLTDSLQLDFAFDYLVEMEAGHGDVHSLNPALQFKWLMWEREATGTSLGLKGNLGRGVHVRGPRIEPETSGHLRLLLTQTLGPVELDLNAGYDFVGHWIRGADDGYMTSVALRRAVSERLSLLGEIVGVHPRGGGATEGLLAFAVKFSSGDGWHWDALVGTGLGRDAPEFRAVLGFVREL